EYDLWWDALTQADKREQAAAARCLILSYEFQDAGLNNYVNRQIPSDHSDPTSTETIDIFSKLSTDTLTMLDRYFLGELIERPASEAA
ncbi:hypothetical protein, partial [Asticcacaulis benevestitus]|uniref:hypothetical protein n=1 Tax=Asticcacaulis benevestitus TaxID=347481 RepID=UPI0005516AC5